MTEREIYIWLGLLGLMAVTVITRSGLIALGKEINLPARLQRALRFAPIAALVAIIIPATLTDASGIALGITNVKIWSAIASVLAWWYWRHTAVGIAVGIGVFLLGRFLIPGG